jgi:hypothetical protein
MVGRQSTEGSQSCDDASSSLDWDPIHEMVQEVFQSLAGRIHAQEPDTSSKAGRTATRGFALFAYRVFEHLDGKEADSVVVGISFTPKHDRVQIAGDISGDESGYIYFDEGCTIETAWDPRAVMQGATTIARRLAAQNHLIVEAIRNRPAQFVQERRGDRAILNSLDLAAEPAATTQA